MLVFISVSPVFAKDSPVNRMQTHKARGLTIDALKLLEDGNWDGARKKIAESADPLASKIYLWMLLQKTRKEDWTDELFIRLSHFIRQNPEWPNVARIKSQA